MRARAPLFFTSLAMLALGGGLAAASEVKIFRTETREAMLEGTLEGVSADALGVLELAPRVERLATLDEPFVFAAAGHPQGWVVGTGSAGKVLRVDAAGGVAELLDAEEPQIFAVHADADGTVVAASSPAGKVYRIAGGEAEVVFEPGEKYIWAVDRDRDGHLLVATGLRGRLYRLDSRSGEAEVLLESRDNHVRALAVLADGSILAGTAGQGLILRVAPGGEVTTLHDGVHPEILAFATAPGGVTYAAVLASEASQVDLSGQRPAKTEDGDKSEDGGEATVVVVGQGDQTVGSRSAGFTGPRSVVLEISANGRVDEILEFQDETVHSLLWQDGALWIGTGQEGHLYRYADGRRSQERVFDEQQLTALAVGAAGVAVVTANAAAIYRLDGEREAEGTYTSKVLDAGQVARFGSFLWEGSLPKGANVALAFRSGMSSKPDDTWTAWDCGGCVKAAECRDGDAGCRGRRQEVALGDVAHGRYVQWRATLKGGERTPRLAAAELTYRQENLRPKVVKLEVLDPGEILVPQSFNPSSQVFEPWSPNREGIFTTLRKEAKKNGDGRLKTLWKKGYRTLRWSAKDANEDELHYRLDFRPASLGAAASGDGSDAGDGWLKMIDELEEPYYSFDATVLPDGVYRFRLTASDAPAQAVADALATEELSEPVVVDHSPPVVAGLKRHRGVLEVEIRDDLSPVRGAVYSVDAGEWQPAQAADGLLDGRRETLHIKLPAGSRMLLLRLTDAAFNVVTSDLLEAR